MSEKKTRKRIFRWVHLETIIVIVAYFLLSNFIFLRSVSHPNIWLSFLVPLIFGVGSSLVFLYLFSHEDFFYFIKSLEKQENKQEKKYLSKFKRYGKMVTCILISAIGGPIFLALTVRFLFSKKENRYLIATVSNIISTILIVMLVRVIYWKI